MPTIIGAEDLVHAPQPAILAPNHESDIDTPLVLLALPHAWRSRTVVGAASDRFYRKRGFAIASGFWINTFPFDRGGGQRRGLAAAADHQHPSWRQNVPPGPGSYNDHDDAQHAAGPLAPPRRQSSGNGPMPVSPMLGASGNLPARSNRFDLGPAQQPRDFM